MSTAQTRRDGQFQAARVRELRARLGLTQEQLAMRLGVSFVTVNRWEKGRSGVSAAALRRLDDLEKIQAPHPAPGAPPVPLSSFVGREPEIAALTQRLTCGPGHAGH